ncbi:MAG: hypothetical protein PHU49_09185 [Syntrophorhabdaceae bacterium]|nr:hypothetical protein [Syntrophorhabdaceae bacterium]MDD5244176.1 hypothetical protein [Syntrophorhabdaceae bacterium]
MNRTAKSYIIIILLFFIVSGGFIPVKVITITTVDGVARLVKMVHDGDTIMLSHINSIYDAKVEEVLRVEGLNFCLAEVKTDSYGVKEYYGITEGIQPRSWKEIRFYNSAVRHFSLAVNDKEFNIRKFTDSLLIIKLQKTRLHKYFSLLIFKDCTLF